MHLEFRIVVSRWHPLGTRRSRLEVPRTPRAVALGHLATHVDELAIPCSSPEDVALRNPQGLELREWSLHRHETRLRRGPVRTAERDTAILAILRRAARTAIVGTCRVVQERSGASRSSRSCSAHASHGDSAPSIAPWIGCDRGRGPDERHAPRAGVCETLRPVDRRRESRQRCRPDDAVGGEA
jgi:hypothetical protein